MDLAGYANISATACQINLPYKGNMSRDQDSDKKIFLPTFINKFRLVGCLDPGSDVTLMHESLFNKICHNKLQLQKSNIPEVTSFSDHSISIIGTFNCMIKLNPAHKIGINVNIHVIKDIPNQTPWLLGSNIMANGSGELRFKRTESGPTPYVYFNEPIPYECTTYYVAPRELFLCSAYVDLGPNETEIFEFNLPSASPLVRTDYILITSLCWGETNIPPTRTDIEYYSSRDYYIGCAQVRNNTDTHFKGIVQGKFELITSYDVVPLKSSNKSLLTQLLSQYPLGREILPVGDQIHVHTPCPVIYQNTVSHKDDMQVSDLDLADTIMEKEPTYTGEADIGPHIIEPHGLDLPTIIYKDAAEAIDLGKYKGDIKNHIEEIFIKKYPGAVSLHALDAGNFSLTLGYTQLRLREGETLPRAKRIFHISPSDQRHLDDICDFLIKFGYIKRAPVSPTGHHLYGVSAYLIPRAKPGCLGRLIVDFSPINSLLESPPNVIPEITATLQFLQGKALYSSLDLRYAFLALKLDEQSQPLTTFLTPSGSYRWISLPTGSSTSPMFFGDACNKILHYEPVRDEEGNVVYDAPNVVKLRRDPLQYVTNYVDDILITSPLKDTYAATLEFHFSVVEQTIKRLAFHGAKINVSKCEFAKGKILFLGWYISHDYILADPRRVDKVKNFKFPDGKKSVRAFLGLVNSLRRVININVVRQMAILSPLTSSKATFNPTPAQRTAFEQIKVMLISEPLFGNLINERAEKFMFVDAASSTGVLGCTLAQRITGHGEKVVPDCLDLDDEVHRIIFDKELPYEPVTLYTSLPIELPKTTSVKTVPPVIHKEERLLGYTEENVNDSFFWSIISILALYRGALLGSVREYRQQALKKLKSGILNNKLKDFTFNLNRTKYLNFIDDFAAGKVGLDPDFYLVEAMASFLRRPLIFISTLERHKAKPIFSYNEKMDTPPLIFGIYQREGYEIFKPYFLNKHVVFKLDSLKGKIQIIAYMAKSVPEAFKSRPIMDIECYAILVSLYSMQRFISGVKVTLLTDSRVLFYLFTARVHNSCVKIKRWCVKLISDYPLVTLHFIRTTENLSDFLTREGLPAGDLERFNVKDAQICDFYDQLPKLTYTLEEWNAFVEQHPEYLTVNKPDHLNIKAQVSAIKFGLNNIEETITPLKILQQRLTREEIIARQKVEYADLYNGCLRAPNFSQIVQIKDKHNTFALAEDLLLVETAAKDGAKILVPPSLIGSLLSYIHLVGHLGLTRMLANLQSYHFANKYSLTRQFVNCCYSCFLSQTGTRRAKLGMYPAPQRPFQELMMDLAENLNPVQGYQHLLIMQCVLTDFLLLIPLKSKTAEEIDRMIINCALMQFNVEKIISDNGPGFRNTKILEHMQALGITVVNTASLHPMGRGSIERVVQSTKLMLRKMLATKPTFNWKYLPYICAKVFNSTISPKTGFAPSVMVFGSENAGKSFLDLDHIAIPHNSIKNNKLHVEQLTKEIAECTRVAREKLIALRNITTEKLNKHKVNKEFEKHDYVFVLDRSYTPGAAKPLRTKLQSSPYIVLKVLFSTVLVERIADKFRALYSKNDLKKFDGGSTLFMDIPTEVTKTLLHSFTDLLSEDFATIAKYDALDIPTGIPLMDEENIDAPDASSDEEFEKRVLQNLDKDILLEPEAIELHSDDSDEDDPEKPIVTRSRSRKVTFQQ